MPRPPLPGWVCAYSTTTSASAALVIQALAPLMRQRPPGKAVAAVVMAGFVPLVLLTRWAQRHQRNGYRRTRTAIARVVVHFVESMVSIRAVQAFERQLELEQSRRDDADADNAAATDAVIGAGRLGTALMIGARLHAGAAAQLPRPINLMTVGKLLDRLRRHAARGLVWSQRLGAVV